MEWFEELRAVRIALDLSQEQLAPRLNVTVRTYARWEKGKTKKAKLLELAKAKELLAEQKRRKK
jgi:transcriptional regulator with XRE-family HTH domain